MVCIFCRRYRILDGTLTWFLTWVILGIHAVHGFSEVVEFEKLDSIDKTRLAELVKDPRYERYSIYGQV